MKVLANLATLGSLGILVFLNSGLVRAEETADPRRPRFQLIRPAMAYELSGSIKAFGNHDLSPLQGGQNPARAISIAVQFQPTFFQSFGVLSLGPELSIYPLPPSSTATTRFYSVWGAGGQIQYQARFVREQILVPVVGYSGEFLRYSLNQGPSGQMMTQGPYFGGYFLLNTIEPSAAADMYANHEVVRSYLVAEVRKVQGSDANLTISGSSFFFGVRIEK